jgi:hypothetical protein
MATSKTPFATERQAQFMALSRGIATPRVAKAFRVLTPGIDWTGSAKKRMAEEWALGICYPSVTRITAEELETAFAPLPKALQDSLT